MYDYNIIKNKKSMVPVVSPSSRSRHRRNERSFVDSLSCLHKESFKLCLNVLCGEGTLSPSDVATVRSCIDRVVPSVVKELSVRPMSPPYGPA